MDETHSGRCQNCGIELKSDKEKDMEICLECRRYGLLYGCWPKHHIDDTCAPSAQL